MSLSTSASTASVSAVSASSASNSMTALDSVLLMLRDGAKIHSWLSINGVKRGLDREVVADVVQDALNRGDIIRLDYKKAGQLSLPDVTAQIQLQQSPHNAIMLEFEAVMEEKGKKGQLGPGWLIQYTEKAGSTYSRQQLSQTLQLALDAGFLVRMGGLRKITTRGNALPLAYLDRPERRTRSRQSVAGTGPERRARVIQRELDQLTRFDFEM
ncbi:hypothetical protein C8F01DRAFT_404588 [Mycena amicta]|nr:hypothetical protein C8F01DRAFT_200030 [Mycena amicta]KAJ7070937.1 hypothetical protein C8F01DRAFT_404588 [Mycena amicta]